GPPGSTQSPPAGWLWKVGGGTRDHPSAPGQPGRAADDRASIRLRRYDDAAAQHPRWPYNERLIPAELPVKDALHTLVLRAIEALRVDGTLPDGDPPSFVIERTKNRDHGDFATNAALLLAKPAARKPRDLAAALVAALPADPMLAKVEVAGPGF